VNASLGAIPLEGGVDISPRYMYKGIGQLAKRQTTGYCEPGNHPCNDVGSTSCCPNDNYCYLDSNFIASCCNIGLECSNPCPTSLVLCNATITQSGTAITTSSCCGRLCSASSAFLCASSFGNNCCTVNSTCAISGTSAQCVLTVDPSTSVASVPPTNCPTTQFPCPSEAGGGCCDNGATCTGSGTALYCASGKGHTSATRTGSGLIATNFSTVPKPHGLSTGAKAGIGVGVGLGFCLFLGAFVYFFIVRRRSQQPSQSTGDTNEAPGTAVAMSESSTGARLSPRSPGGTDYFGPMAREGPYTERDGSGVASPHSTDRGVPLSPQGPSDIAVPVEIADSKQTPRVPPPPPGYDAEHTEPERTEPEHTEPIYELP